MTTTDTSKRERMVDWMVEDDTSAIIDNCDDHVVRQFLNSRHRLYSLLTDAQVAAEYKERVK